VIIFACRDQTRAQNAIDKLKVATGLGADNVEFMPLDLDDLVSVKKFADDFNAKYDKLDILLNNAGIMALPERETTK
jgi:NAD(P)-dependent dehydrogenase (short-subunit alcohol dehydrogenase family)